MVRVCTYVLPCTNNNQAAAAGELVILIKVKITEQVPSPNMSVCLSVCLSVFLMLVWRSVKVSLVHLRVRLSVCVSVCLFVGLNNKMSSSFQTQNCIHAPLILHMPFKRAPNYYYYCYFSTSCQLMLLFFLSAHGGAGSLFCS